MSNKTVLYILVSLTLSFFFHESKEVAIELIKNNKKEAVDKRPSLEDLLLPSPLILPQKSSIKNDGVWAGN